MAQLLPFSCDGGHPAAQNPTLTPVTHSFCG